MSETLISVGGVSKKFCRSLRRSLWYGMKDIGSELLGRRHGGNGSLRADEFWAVKDVGFELKRGECLGLIGHNGAGKTTLLRMLNGLIKPDIGRIEMCGRVGALIALGAGFNPILTGRENIYVNASVLGLSKREIDERIDGIIDFAEIGDFIDMPVQNYSSGMQVRLGFSVATALKPDILLLDEVLAVGDVRFQAKCFSRIAEMKSESAVIFVSHTMSSVARISDRVILLHEGSVEADGFPQDSIDIYLQKNRDLNVNQLKKYDGSGEIKIEDILVKVDYIERQQCKLTKIRADIYIASYVEDKDVVLDFVFRGLDGIAVAEYPSTKAQSQVIIGGNQKSKIEIEIETVPISTGDYYCSFFILDKSCTKHYHAWLNFEKVHICSDQRFTSPIQLPAKWKFQDECVFNDF